MPTSDLVLAAGGGSLTVLLLWVIGALSISFLCSVLEATLLSTRIVSLTARKQRGDKGAAILLKLKQHRLEDAISAILTFNTISHTVGAGLAAAEAEALWGEDTLWGYIGYVALFMGILTILFLVFTEIIPKTLGTVHASKLVGFVSRTIVLLIILLKPVLIMTRVLTDLVSSHDKKPVSKGELSALVALASKEGALRKHETDVFSNVLRIDEILTEDIMTPRTVATMKSVDTTVQELLEDEEASTYSRLPLYEDKQDNVAGYILQREVFGAIARGADKNRKLSEFKREVWFIPEKATVGDALHQFLDKREHMAMVVDEYGGVSGLITIEDIIETILGHEILDEIDKVADLRTVAAQHTRERLKRLREDGNLSDSVQIDDSQVDIAVPPELRDDSDESNNPDDDKPDDK